MAERTVTAAVIIIGNEILSGRTQDENLPFLARELNELGIQVREARVVPYLEAEIVTAGEPGPGRPHPALPAAPRRRRSRTTSSPPAVLARPTTTSRRPRSPRRWTGLWGAIPRHSAGCSPTIRRRRSTRRG